VLTSSRRQQARRVQDEEQLGGDVNERREKRVQEAKAREHDAQSIDRESADEILPDDATTSAGDAESFAGNPSIGHSPISLCFRFTK